METGMETENGLASPSSSGHFCRVNGLEKSTRAYTRGYRRIAERPAAISGGDLSAIMQHTLLSRTLCGFGRAKFQIWCQVTASAEQLFAQNIWWECRQSTP
jgi:hypothetical protein